MPELLGHAEMERGSAKKAQTEQSEGEPNGCPLAGSLANKVDLAAGLPPTTRRSKRRMIVISLREGKWSSRRELHLELGLRRAA